MKTQGAGKSRYTVEESYRKQLFGGVINQDPGTRSWSWKAHIDFDGGPYSVFSSRRNFITGPEAESQMRQIVHQRIDNWLSMIQPGAI
jgi:hypothetical protein